MLDSTNVYLSSSNSKNHLERAVNVAGARDNIGGQVVQQFRIQCFNYKEFSHFAKECRKPKRVKDFTYHKVKMLLCKQAEKGVQLQAEQSDWLADKDEEIDEQELEVHYNYMAKIQEVPNADSCTDSEPLEHKANASLTQELTECKSILTKTSRTLGESNSIRDSYLVALQNKQTELEKYIAFNDRIADYEKLKHKLNKTLGLLAQKDIDIKEGSELGSELTLPAGSELNTSELDTSELKTSEYRFLKIFILTSYEQELLHQFLGNIAIVQDVRDGLFRMSGRRYRGSGQARQVKCYNCNGIGHIVRNCTQPKRPQNSEYIKDKMLLMQAQENGVTLDEEQLLFIAGGQDNAVDEDVDKQPVQDLALNVDNVFQADDCDAFDSDVDEAPTAQTMFMANLSSAYPVYDEACLSYDSDVLSEVHDNDHYQDAVCEHHEIHKMHDDVQPNYVVDSHANYTSDSNMIRSLMISTIKPYYDEKNKVAVGYKNPLCLTRAKQVQPALYNGHEIIKTNHVPAIVHNSNDTLEIAKITRKKMKDPEYEAKSQEEQKQDFYEPIKALTMYPPNTLATLVPWVLPTKSQVKINIFTLIQLFSEFEKTCKKRITPTRLTEGERGFKQTKECYLTKVILFFKTLKEHFEGIQKALTKEIKEMKDIFEELEAEVDQNVVDRKHAEIERRNLSYCK
ncbi:integrase, catalytic region, zinc finger, CCHC-type containing protein [Tanacetum coccineum]|uniref:Integrase, catalytic region, zinc finger, CCHC-type containing protein n=1 Tax=Tanacetum coccineum TaxID=301880 RepID=A0ABQ5E403_9ASTR